MAGHFLMYSMPHSDAVIATRHGWSWVTENAAVPTAAIKRMHPGVGWTTASKRDLALAVAESPLLTNRDGLPPHIYLQLAAHAAFVQGAITYITNVDWVEKLKRPAGAGLDLKSLVPAAQQAWDDGNYGQAVLAQAQHSVATLEIYHMSGMQV